MILMADGSDVPSYSHYLTMSGGSVQLSAPVIHLVLWSPFEIGQGEGTFLGLPQPNASLQFTHLLGHLKSVKGCLLSC